MPNQQTVALLISTYNWPQALELVLLSVLAQTRMPDEIIIADDGSDERTKELVANYKTRFGVPLKHVWHEDNGFRKSLILNKAVKQIESEYIIQIDGDIIVHPKFIYDHLKIAKLNYFVQGSRAMITKAKTQEILINKNIAFSMFSNGINNKFNALRLPWVSSAFMLLPSNPFHVKACNIAFWKSDYIMINGYDNGFEGWGGEDYEFAARLIHSGVKRNRLKLSALAYHIFHKVNSRSNTTANDKIYKKTIAKKLMYTNNGIKEV